MELGVVGTYIRQGPKYRDCPFKIRTPGRLTENKPIWEPRYVLGYLAHAAVEALHCHL